MAPTATENVVIVGGGPAGLASARAYRASGGSGTVTLVGEEPLLPYERPPLTKALLRAAVELDALPLETSEWFRTNRIELRLGVAATAIDLACGHVRLADGDTLAADAIVLATGSEPVAPRLDGLGHPRVLAVRRLPDSLRVRELAREGSAIVVGGGFIASEVAGSLATCGVAVTLIGRERLPQCGRVGDYAAGRIAGWLHELGVARIGGAAVSSVHDGRIATLEDGRTFRAACIVLATGVRPRSELAMAAGLLTDSGAIVVDDAMRAQGADGRVLAVGDVAFARNITAGRHLRVEHWGDALAQGEVAGRVLAGHEARWDVVPGFWSTIGERTLKFAGWGEGFDDVRVDDHGDRGFTVWYAQDGVAVGVLSHERDEDYEHGRELIANGAPPP